VAGLESIPGAELRGRSVFLSASFPSPKRDPRFHLIPRAEDAIYEGVIALTRAVRSHGGVLVMGAHPTISPLVAQVAGEYRLPDVERGGGAPGGRAASSAESPIIIYQSKVFEGYLPESTLFLVRQGYARLVWTEVQDDETFEPGKNLDKPPAPKSVEHMRKRMFRETKPDAMVCMGGMEGVINEALLFLDLCRGKRIYALASSGGAAALLKDNKKLTRKVREIDQEILRVVKKPLKALRKRLDSGKGKEGPEVQDDEPPLSAFYPLVMQTIVDEVGRQ
jgi:hypothetical protein